MKFHHHQKYVNDPISQQIRSGIITNNWWNRKMIGKDIWIIKENGRSRGNGTTIINNTIIIVNPFEHFAVHQSSRTEQATMKVNLGDATIWCPHVCYLDQVHWHSICMRSRLFLMNLYVLLWAACTYALYAFLFIWNTCID